jgi:hypothetical protein
MQKAVLHDGILQGMPRRSPAAGRSERHQKLHQIGQWCRSESIEQLRCVLSSLFSACKIDSFRILAPFSHIHTNTHTNNNEKTPQRISIDDVEEEKEEDGQQWTNGSK